MGDWREGGIRERGKGEEEWRLSGVISWSNIVGTTTRKLRGLIVQSSLIQQRIAKSLYYRTVERNVSRVVRGELEMEVREGKEEWRRVGKVGGYGRGEVEPGGRVTNWKKLEWCVRNTLYEIEFIQICVQSEINTDHIIYGVSLNSFCHFQIGLITLTCTLYTF